mmetsp:Transcript_8452/g.11815  ORF Transcript_8452/g.11815 Transcript_8452/m.11815 type:complete len:196 (+) Transcript_8452:113-700(+)
MIEEAKGGALCDVQGGDYMKIKEDLEKSSISEILEKWQRKMLIITCINMVLLALIVILLAALALGANSKMTSLNNDMKTLKDLTGSMNNLMAALTLDTHEMNTKMDSVDSHMEIVANLTDELSGKMDLMHASIDQTTRTVEMADSHAHNIVFNTFEMCKIIHVLDPKKKIPACYSSIGYNTTTMAYSQPNDLKMK